MVRLCISIYGVSSVPTIGKTVTISEEESRVEDLAELLGTIPCEILTSVPRRIRRVVIGK